LPAAFTPHSEQNIVALSNDPEHASKNAKSVFQYRHSATFFTREAPPSRLTQAVLADVSFLDAQKLCDPFSLLNICRLQITLKETRAITVIMALQIRDEDRRQQAIHHLVDLIADRPVPTVFEFRTDDWDEGLWEEEIEWFTELLEGTRDRVVVWRFDDGGYNRFTIGNSE